MEFSITPLTAALVKRLLHPGGRLMRCLSTPKISLIILSTNRGPLLNSHGKHKGKSTTEFVKKDELVAVRRQIGNYRTFKKLTAEWGELSVKIAKMREKTSGS